MTVRERSNVSRIGLAAAVASLALLLGGCFGGGDAASETPPASSAPSPPLGTPPPPTPAPSTPAPASTPYAEPSGVVPGEAGRLVYDRADAVSGYTAYDAVRSDTPFSVEGQCEGDEPGARLAYEVFTAAVDDAGRTLVEGTLVCGAPLANGGLQTPYSGLVQIALRSPTDAIARAWISVVSNP